ncbi:Transcription factor S-II (TFIIS), central domain [Popillia japonica]|uniref:Transcription factor S-II (TFIIS), central domain n=1 Tax=Popillia japonica TaxID=7064 RepID=A0AAW1MCN2_POPJA
MSHSVVKVTENKPTDRLLLVVSEDGTVSPDKEAVESYLNSRIGTTELQVMHVNKFYDNNIDVTVDTLMYVHSEEVIEEEPQEMDQIARNLLSFRMDHDYTPLTSPKRQSPMQDDQEIDELAQTLGILEGSIPEEPPKLTKMVKTAPPKMTKRHVQSQMKSKAKMISSITVLPPKQQPPKAASTPKVSKPKIEEIDSDDYNDEDFEDIDYEDDDNDSDFELDESPKSKNIKKTPNRKQKKNPDHLLKTKVKMSTVKQQQPKVEQDNIKTEKIPEPKQTEMKQPEKKTPQKKEKKPAKQTEMKQPEKKTPQKKEKKPAKPPDDFALFSAPDIIRRVGGKEPTTPTTPVTPESPKVFKPAKIHQEMRSKSADFKTKRTSTETRLRSSIEEHQSKRLSLDKTRIKPERQQLFVKKNDSSKMEGTVSVQGYDESVGSNSSESILESQLEPLPSAEDIRAIIQNENTKSFTTSLVIPDSHDTTQVNDHNNQTNLDSSGLELDQSILDNINTDLISEDILYQVAQSLVDNPELQNVIDKSIVDGNLMLDASLQSINQENTLQPTQMNNAQNSTKLLETPSTSIKGTQIVRSDGRILVLPPIERPTTRSRNKRSENPDARPMKPLDEEHVSGNELDSSNDEQSEEESEDDPNKLWCICNQPHNNRFMICCDTCEEWYHGKCVNVTKAMGQMMEQEGREWICLYCKDPSLKRPSAAARRIRKASRTSTDSSGSQRRSSSVTLQETAKAPSCIVCGKPSRTSSIYCSDNCILKHAQGVEKVVVFERKSGKILSGSNAPSAANLDKWLVDHPGFEVVRSTSKPSAVKKMSQSKLQLVKNTSNDGVSLAIQRKGVNIGILHHQPKNQQQIDSTKQHKKITGLKIISKQVSSTNQPKQTKLINPVPVTKPQVTTTTTPLKTKVTTPIPKTPPTPTTPKEKPMPQKTPKSRQAEVASTPQPKTENIRENVRKTLMEQLTNRIKLVDDLKLTEEEISNISVEIENQLFKCFGDTGQKYRNKYRSLIFNIKDIKNQTLWKRICEKSINPYQLVRLSPDDLASQELALWREREAKHQLDMIKKSELELLNCNRQYVFKTHKGEQVFEDDRPTDQTVTEVITGLGADSTSADKEEGKKELSKDKDRKFSSKHKKERSRDKDRKLSKEKSDSKDKRKDPRSTSRDKDRERDRRKRSRSRDHNRHNEKRRSRSRDKERHRRSHKSSRHKKDVHNTTEKLDKKSKEILEQLVDKQIVPPLEDRLWKHVPQEDIVQAATVESDSDHEPTSTVTIPTPPRPTEPDEIPSIQAIDVHEKNEKQDIIRTVSIDSTESLSPKDDSPGLSPIIKPQTEHVWKGTINMVDVAQISITAHEVSGDCSGLSEELPSSLDIVGRISPETVWDYIGKMKCSNSKMISLLRLNATNIEEKMPYIALYSYLSSRKRLGVVKSTNKAVKDFYIFPLGGQMPIPQALLPINGPGFEESRPPLLVGVIVRDKRKRPIIDSTPAVIPKKIKVDVAVVPPAASTPPISTASTPSRSYTPPPNRDPRIKIPYNPTTMLPTPPINTSSPPTPGDDMDEPYSPEDSDPEATTPPLPIADPTQLTNNLPVIPNAIKQSSFLDTALPTQTFKPFTSKFDTIPGLEEPAPLPSNSVELQRKMAELDQRIAMHKAEIDNMSQDLVSATASDIGTSALANIALPSNLQQILDSIKTIGAVTNETVDAQPAKTVQTSQQDLTIPLMLPKISSRPLTGTAAASQKADGLSPTIPLNLPKIKSKHSATNSPQRMVDEKSTSVLSSLSEEDLIRKAEEMLGETGPVQKKSKDKEIATPAYNQNFSTIYNTPPPVLLAPSNILNSTTVTPPLKRSKIDLSQPPIPGLEDEC